jgi:hypothetical protein
MKDEENDGRTEKRNFPQTFYNKRQRKVSANLCREEKREREKMT